MCDFLVIVSIGGVSVLMDGIECLLLFGVVDWWLY